MKVKVGDLVHENYIAKYIKKSLCLIIRVNVSDSPVHPETWSSAETIFDCKTHYLYCKELIIKSSKYAKHPKLDGPYSKVSTLNFDQTLHEDIDKRYDEWGAIVKETIFSAVADLFASSAIYQRYCQKCFKAGKGKPTQENIKIIGRPVDIVKEGAFEKMAKYFKDNNEEQYTLREGFSNKIIIGISLKTG